MISWIEGRVIDKGPRSIVLDVGGVGYRLYLGDKTLKTLTKGKKTALWAHLAVREDSLNLYGFAKRDELHCFELLITVSGIGPKTALAILGVANVSVIKRAVSSGDTSYLTRVCGIGSKTAAKIVLELKERIGTVEEKGLSVQEEIDAVEALKALGYSQPQAREALQKVPKDLTGTGERIKQALKFLGGKK